MTTPRLRRSGVTLLEVLVSMLVMAIGLLALLTLFPLGATENTQSSGFGFHAFAVPFTLSRDARNARGCPPMVKKKPPA